MGLGSSRLSLAERKKLRSVLRLQLALPLWEIIELTIDTFNLSYFLSKDRITDNTFIEDKLYVAAIALAIITSIYTLCSHILMARETFRTYYSGFAENVALHRTRKSTLLGTTSSKKVVPTERLNYENNSPSEHNEERQRNYVSYELKLLRSKQKIHYYKTMILVGMFEDLPLFLVLLYRLTYGSARFVWDGQVTLDEATCPIPNQELIPCLYQEQQEAIETTSKHILVCTFGLALKFSYIRDLFKEQAMQQTFKEKIFHNTSLNKTVLDEFLDISEEEIRNVLAIRKMLSDDNINTSLPGILSDIRILRVLRFQKLGVLETTQYLRSWMRWRKAYDCDHIREEIFQENYSYSELPSLISCIFQGIATTENEDKKCSKFVIYYYGGSMANLRLLSTLSNDEILKRYIYDCEFFDILLEHLSLERQRLVDPIMLGYSSPCTTEEQNTLKKLKCIQGCPSYPHFLAMKSFTPFSQPQAYASWISHISSEDACNNFSDEYEAYEAISEALTSSFIPKEFSPVQNKVRRQSLTKSFSKFSGLAYVNKYSFSKAKKIDTKKKHQVRRVTSIEQVFNDPIELDRINTEVGIEADSSDPWGLMSFVAQPLSDLTNDFMDINLFRDVTMLEVSEVKEIKKMLREKVENIDLEGSSFLGNVNLLRIIRQNQHVLEDALEEAQEVLKLRMKHNLPEIHNDIVDKNLEIEKLPNWREYIQLKPCLGIIERDKYGNILILRSTVDDVKGHHISGENEDEIDEKIRLFELYLGEYLSILVDRLSRAEKRIISIVEVHDATGVSFRKINKQLYQSHKLTDNIFSSTCMPRKVLYGVQEKNYMIRNLAKSSLFSTIIKANDFEYFYKTASGDEKFRARFGLYGTEIFKQERKTLINWKYPKLNDLVEQLKECNVEDVNGLTITGFPDVSEREVNGVLSFRKKLLILLGKDEFQKHPRNVLGSVSLLRLLRNHNFNTDHAIEEVKAIMKVREQYNMSEANKIIWSKNLVFSTIPYFKLYQALTGAERYFKRDQLGNIVRLAGIPRKANLAAVRSTYIVRDSNKLAECIVYMNEYASIVVDELSRLEKKVLSVINFFDVQNFKETFPNENLNDYISSKQSWLGVAAKNPNINAMQQLNDQLKRFYTSKNTGYDVYFGDAKLLKSSSAKTSSDLLFENNEQGNKRLYGRFGMGVGELRFGFNNDNPQGQNLTDLMQYLHGKAAPSLFKDRKKTIIEVTSPPSVFKMLGIQEDSTALRENE